MRGLQCDRCGEFQQVDESRATGWTREETEIQFYYQWSGDEGRINREGNTYDLCNDCRAELVEWVEGDYDDD